jgi:hypothetical protein
MESPMKTAPAFLSSLVILGWAVAAPAAQFVYPAKGQSVGQQAHDEAECSNWAVGQSGFDPATTPQPTVAAEPQHQQGFPGGSQMAGIASQAALGAFGGGSGIGAIASALGPSLLNQAQPLAAAQTTNQQPELQRYQTERGAYDQARAACLTGRGYSVR